MRMTFADDYRWVTHLTDAPSLDDEIRRLIDETMDRAPTDEELEELSESGWFPDESGLSYIDTWNTTYCGANLSEDPRYKPELFGFCAKCFSLV